MKNLNLQSLLVIEELKEIEEIEENFDIESIEKDVLHMFEAGVFGFGCIFDNIMWRYRVSQLNLSEHQKEEIIKREFDCHIDSGLFKEYPSLSELNNRFQDCESIEEINEIENEIREEYKLQFPKLAKKYIRKEPVKECIYYFGHYRKGIKKEKIFQNLQKELRKKIVEMLLDDNNLSSNLDFDFQLGIGHFDELQLVEKDKKYFYNIAKEGEKEHIVEDKIYRLLYINKEFENMEFSEGASFYNCSFKNCTFSEYRLFDFEEIKEMENCLFRK